MTPLDALQEALAGEHAAIYVMGVLGAQTSQSGQPELYRAIDRAHATHRAQRDRLVQFVQRADAEPVAAAPSYVLPNEAATPQQVTAAARLTEDRCLDLYGQLVENSTGATRAWAITALSAAAVRVISLGAQPESFPGLTSR